MNNRENRRLALVRFANARGHNVLSRGAFTLFEMLVIVFVILILIALLLPAVQASREAVRKTQCMNHLFQIGVGLHNYHDAHKTFPPGYVSDVGLAGEDLGPGWAWGAMLLPFLGQATIWREIEFEESPNSKVNRTIMSQLIELFLCPSDWGGQTQQTMMVASFGYGSMAADPDRGDGVFFRNSRIRIKDIEDGAMTFLAGERAGANGGAHWASIGRVPATNRSLVLAHAGADTSPATLVPTPTSENSGNGQSAKRGVRQVHVHQAPKQSTCSEDFGGTHLGGSNYLLLDGSVRFVSNHIASDIFAALGSRRGGEPVNSRDF